jgi:hypothetical protein
MEAKISSLLHELDTLGDNKPSNTLLTRVTKALRKSKVKVLCVQPIDEFFIFQIYND